MTTSNAMEILSPLGINAVTNQSAPCGSACHIASLPDIRLAQIFIAVAMACSLVNVAASAAPPLAINAMMIRLVRQFKRFPFLDQLHNLLAPQLQSTLPI
jgi:hypothetical protein